LIAIVGNASALVHWESFHVGVSSRSSRGALRAPRGERSTFDDLCAFGAAPSGSRDQSILVGAPLDFFTAPPYATMRLAAAFSASVQHAA